MEINVKSLKLKYLIMKFISIPKNGSSWRERLPYSFTTESQEKQDVTLEIVNSTTGVLLGTMRLYGVTEAEVDIAPYIRQHLSLAPLDTSRQVDLQVSPSAISVMVRVGGVASEARVFFRMGFDYSAVGVLSGAPQSQTILSGETIRLTIFSQLRVEATVTVTGGKGPTVRCEGLTYGMPMELIVPTRLLSGAERVSVMLRCDGKGVIAYTYNVAPRLSTAQRLVWYNAKGGIESYLFDHAMHLNYTVSREDDHATGAKSVDGRVRYRLCSGCELQAEMDRITQLMLSPVVYREVGGICREVAVESREVEFDSKGLLHTLKLDLSEAWKGGKLW